MRFKRRRAASAAASLAFLGSEEGREASVEDEAEASAEDGAGALAEGEAETLVEGTVPTDDVGTEVDASVAPF